MAESGTKRSLENEVFTQRKRQKLNDLVFDGESWYQFQPNPGHWIKTSESDPTLRKFYYNSSFRDRLDFNTNLIGVSNGIIDISTGTFRLGLPEDYVSKSTGFPYIAK
jgi:phage/plasmid-associated DNA primase